MKKPMVYKLKSFLHKKEYIENYKKPSFKKKVFF